MSTFFVLTEIKISNQNFVSLFIPYSIERNSFKMKKNLPLLFFLLIGPILFSQTKGDPVYIQSIYFGGGDYRIDKVQKKDLSDFLQSIPNIEEYEISVHGHTDDIGGVEYNQWLSEMRSEMVVRQVVLENITRESIGIKDFGELNPIYDNNTWEGKLKNRRADIVLKKIVM